MNISYVLYVVSREVAVVEVVHGWLCVPASACFLPDGLYSSAVAGHEDVGVGEAVELLEVLGASLPLEHFQEDEVLSVLQGGELYVFNGLEEGGGLALHVALLLGLVAG
mgnify:CR=1 FL=1